MVPAVLRRLTRRTRLAARYVALRHRLAMRFDAEALDALVASILVAPHRRAPLEDLTWGVRLGERVAGRLGGGPDTCLFRALARTALLREHGVPAAFVMGIDPTDPDAGHAWVEVDERPWREARSPAGFARTFSHP